MFLKINYFFYFFFLGIFFNLVPGHFETLNFNGGKRAFIFASIPVFGFIFNIIWGYLSDLLHVKIKLIAFLSLIASISLFFIFKIDTYKSYLLMSLVMGGIIYPLIPLYDSITMNFAASNSISYGSFRWWGTFSFIFANFIVLFLCYFFKINNEKYLMMLMPLTLLFITIICLTKKEFPSPPLNNFKFSINVFSLIFKKNLLIFLIVVFLHNISFVSVFSYLSPHLKSLKYSQVYISFFWGISPIFEIFVFKYSKTILSKFNPFIILKVAILLGILKWFIMAYFSDTFSITLSQVMHSFVFGGYYIASIAILYKLIPSELRSTGQGIFASSISLSLFIGNILFGKIFDLYGTFMIFKLCIFFATFSFIVSLYVRDDKNNIVTSSK